MRQTLTLTLLVLVSGGVSAADARNPNVIVVVAYDLG